MYRFLAILCVGTAAVRNLQNSTPSASPRGSPSTNVVPITSSVRMYSPTASVSRSVIPSWSSQPTFSKKPTPSAYTYASYTGYASVYPLSNISVSPYPSSSTSMNDIVVPKARNGSVN